MTDKNNTNKTVIIASGGTGGHLYPAESLAQELLNRNYKVIIITDKRGTAFQKLGDRVRIECIKAATFKAGIISRLKALFTIGIGVLQASLLLLKYKPVMLVGFGGYPSYPTVFAAQLLGFKTMLHEQNAVLGKANFHLANKADAIAASLPDTRGIVPANQNKVFVTGNPVREGICAARENPYPPFNGTLEIFITGGSQAAAVFSQIIPEAVKLLPDDIKNTLRVVQQCKEYDIESTAKKYRDAGIKAEVKSFFDDMPERISKCHIFIGRSGASTVSEIAVIGRPAIFIPYPGHEDQQQKHNAEIIAGKNGAWIMEQHQLTPCLLSKKIEYLAKNPDILENAASIAKSCGKPEAVNSLANLVEERINK